MAVPSDPTHLELIRDGMILGGQYNLTTTSTAVTNFANRQFQTIKTQFWASCSHDDLLETVSIVTTTTGSRSITLPTDFDHEIWVRLYDGNEERRGTIQTGSSTSVTLASSFESNELGLLGAYLFFLEGGGSGQRAQIASYSNTSKIATFSAAISTTFTASTTYLVSEFWYDLPKQEILQGYERNTRPTRYRLRGATLEVEPPADKVYPIELRYGTNLTRLDETGSVFVKHLRERRVYWEQAVKAYTMQIFDDSRADAQTGLWNQMLTSYAAKNAPYERLLPNR